MDEVRRSRPSSSSVRPLLLWQVLAELNQKMNEINKVRTEMEEGGDMASTTKLRAKKDALEAEVQGLLNLQKPLKWVNRVIMWCADKMPSMVDGIDGKDTMDVNELVRGT